MDCRREIAALLRRGYGEARSAPQIPPAKAATTAIAALGDLGTSTADVLLHKFLRFCVLLESSSDAAAAEEARLRYATALCEVNTESAVALHDVCAKVLRSGPATADEALARLLVSLPPVKSNVTARLSEIIGEDAELLLHSRASQGSVPNARLLREMRDGEVTLADLRAACDRRRTVLRTDFGWTDSEAAACVLDPRWTDVWRVVGERIYGVADGEAALWRHIVSGVTTDADALRAALAGLMFMEYLLGVLSAAATDGDGDACDVAETQEASVSVPPASLPPDDAGDEDGGDTDVDEDRPSPPSEAARSVSVCNTSADTLASIRAFAETNAASFPEGLPKSLREL